MKNGYERDMMIHTSALCNVIIPPADLNDLYCLRVFTINLITPFCRPFLLVAVASVGWYVPVCNVSALPTWRKERGRASKGSQNTTGDAIFTGPSRPLECQPSTLSAASLHKPNPHRDSFLCRRCCLEAWTREREKSQTYWMTMHWKCALQQGRRVVSDPGWARTLNPSSES